MSRPWGVPRASRLATYAVALAALAGCGGSSPETLDGPSGPVDCQAIIDDTAAEAIGWPGRPASNAATVADGRCERRFPAVGVITVGSLDVTDGAQQSYDAQCARLDKTGRADAELATAVVGGGTACAAGLDASTQTGLAELVALTADGQVLHVRVDAQAAVVGDALRKGLAALIGAAQRAW